MEVGLTQKFLGSPWARYAGGLLLFGLALAARLALLPVEARLAFSAFYPAVVLAMYFCGVGPGTLVAVLGALVGIYYFSPPYFTWGADSAGRLAASAYLFASAMIGWVVHRLQTTSERLRDAHDRLRSSERMLKTVVGDQTEMLFRFGRDGRFVFANPAGRSAFGLTDESMASQTWHALWTPEERAGVIELLRKLTPDRPQVQTETQFAGPSGETRWGEFVHRATFDTDGQLSEVQTVGRDITERRALQVQLAEVTARLQDLYDRAPCGYYSVDAQATFVQINSTCLAWLGCTAGQVIGTLGPKDFFTPDGVAEFERNFAEFLSQGHVGPVEFDLIGRDGAKRRVSVSATAIMDADGTFLRSRSVMYDVTELDRVRRKLSLLNRQQAAMLDNELVGIIKLKDRQASWANRAMERIFGYGPGELEGKSARTLYPDDAAYEAVGAAAYPALASGGTYRTQLRMKRKDGTAVWIDVSGSMISVETDESMWMMLDITALKDRQEEVEQIAFHDALTGLPNRILLADRLRQAVSTSERLHDLFAVCFIDLDGFKAVNDTSGHAVGDRLLQIVGNRLQECVRGNDTVARLGGDEFVVLLSHLQSRGECDQILARVRAALAKPFDVGEGAVGRVSASIGVALYPDDSSDGEQLLKLADAAMYAAKKSARYE